MRTIDQMFAFVVKDEFGNDGIPAIRLGDTAYPLVGADMDRINSYMPSIEAMKNDGIQVRLMRFQKVEETVL